MAQASASNANAQSASTRVPGRDGKDEPSLADTLDRLRAAAAAHDRDLPVPITPPLEDAQ